MSEWKEFREELMQDPDVKATYDAHAPEREIARVLMALQGNISRMERRKGGSAVAKLKRLCSAEYTAGGFVLRTNIKGKSI